MPKLNATLMVLLAAAVIAATGILVLRTSSATEDPRARAQVYLRKLAEADSDLRKEGEDGLRGMGSAAIMPLKEASTSPDRLLAGRAAKLLLELQPPAPAERGAAVE